MPVSAAFPLAKIPTKQAQSAPTAPDSDDPIALRRYLVRCLRHYATSHPNPKALPLWLLRVLEIRPQVASPDLAHVASIRRPNDHAAAPSRGSQSPRPPLNRAHPFTTPRVTDAILDRRILARALRRPQRATTAPVATCAPSRADSS